MTSIDPTRIDWRVSNTWDKDGAKWGMLVAYIDARTAMEKLDELDASWSSRMEPIELEKQVGIRCTLTVNGVSREDVGVPSNTEPLKGAFSDALKRAAVQFGIGRELYEMPKIAVQCEVGRDGKVKRPKALPTYHNGRWDIDRKVGWVRYDQEPPHEQSEERNTRAALTPDALRYSIAVALKKNGLDHAYLERIADSIGASKPATQPQLAEMLRMIEEGIDPSVEQPDAPIRPAPQESVPSGGQHVGARADVPAPPANEQSGGGTPPAAVPADITVDQILEAAGPGAELVPPRPGSDAYKALPDGVARAEARNYWEARKAEAA